MKSLNRFLAKLFRPVIFGLAVLLLIVIIAAIVGFILLGLFYLLTTQQ